MTNIAVIQGMNGVDRFQQLVDVVKDCAIYMLDPEGHVISWNSGAERLNGYSELEILGRHFSCFYTKDEVAEGLPDIALTTAKASSHFEIEGWRIRKDGSRFRALVVINPIWEEGELVGFAKFTRDISQKVKAEQELKGAREALRNAQKMDVLARLTSGVAHEFGNILAVLRSGLDRMNKANLSVEDHGSSQKFLIDTIDQATSLASQLLTFSRSQPLRPEQFDVIERLLTLRPLLETMLGDNITLKMHLVPDLIPVDTDRHQFETAIINLVVNAREALVRSAGNGNRVVTLSASAVTECPKILADMPSPGKAAIDTYVAISVTDNGPGIAGGAAQRMFEPFFTTKDSNSGAGLGLSQVQEFARQSGGDIEGTDTPGGGATFTLYLPRVRRRIVNAINIETKIPEMTDEPKLTGAVLLVEDNARMADTSLALLEDLGLQATWARDAEDAIVKLQQPDANFDLVLTDVVMPGMSGIALARFIARRWPDLPVLLTSGYSDDLAAGHGSEFSLIHKPYGRKMLLGALQPYLSVPDRAA